MEIICNICQKEIDVKNVDQDQGVIKCNECNSIIEVDAQAKSARSTKRAEVALPGSFRLKECEDCLKMEYLWRGSQLIFLTPFSIAWVMIPILYYSNGLQLENDLLIKYYMILHAFLGIGLIYYCLAGFINKTQILVSKELLKVKDIPLFFFRNVDIGIDKLDQLYAKEKVVRGRKRSISWSSFEVYAITKSDGHFRLVAGLNNVNQALYIEQELENYLGIVDQEVKGEIER